ncbi:MAG: hypothetical protein ACI4DY_05790 [Monoglobaceae bacterium]
MKTETSDYNSYDFDTLHPGYSLKIEHTVYNNDNADLSDLISMPLADVVALHESSIATEQSAYEKVRAAAKEWEKCAAATALYNRAVEYLKIPEVNHTFNKWEKGKSEYDYTVISNRVYKMSYRVREGYSWRGKPAKWEVRWDLYTNSPRTNYNVRIAGQEKSYANKEDAEKYMQGRIKAYSHLFTEISPAIPDEHKAPFSLYGQLLPGYTTESMQKAVDDKKISDIAKPSIRNQLNELKSQSKNNLQTEPAKKHPVPELE